MHELKCCRAIASLLVFSASFAQAASFSGTVTDKTTNKPSPGDIVTLVDVQAGMADAGRTTTDSSGRYTLNPPGVGAYLVRVTHQGASYFIAAPQTGAGDVNVYDVAPKVDGVGIDANMFLIEAGGGMLRIHQRFLIRNTSLPPRAQFSEKTFEIAIPSGAELDSAATTRPGGMGTNTTLIPLAKKGHYTFNTPIQPNQAEKETMFELQYHLPYAGKYTFEPSLLMPADHLVVYMPPGMSFSNAQGASFQPAQQDPKVQTFVASNVHSGQSIAFTITGEGQMQAASQNESAGMAAPPMGQPGGGIGAPIASPDPLTTYKGWILATLGALLLGAAAFLLRRNKLAATGSYIPSVDERNLPQTSHPVKHPVPAPSLQANDLLLQNIKEELFSIESDRLSGKLSEEEYARIRAGLEAVLKRTLKG